MSAAKIYRLDISQIHALITGAARIRNLPKDAQVIAAVACHDKDGPCLGLRVHSSTFPMCPHGQPLPVVTAVIERSQPESSSDSKFNNTASVGASIRSSSHV